MSEEPAAVETVAETPEAVVAQAANERPENVPENPENPLRPESWTGAPNPVYLKETDSMRNSPAWVSLP